MGSKEESIENVCIVGSGTMGRAISITFARKGIPVTLVQMRKNKDALSLIKTTLDKELEKGKITHSVYSLIIENIRVIKGIENLKKCSFIIEAVVENLDIKVNTMKKILSTIYDPEDVIVATNTSSLDVKALEEKSNCSGRLIGMHFFNPPYRIPFVEMTFLETTLPEIKNRAKSLLKQIDVEYICVKNTPGFIVNRLLFTYLNEAYRLLDEEGYSLEDIDFAMVKATGHPMGPFRLSDYIGLDVCLEILENLYEETGQDVRYEPPEILRGMVKKSFLGKKSGKGFYEYGGEWKVK